MRTKVLVLTVLFTACGATASAQGLPQPQTVYVLPRAAPAPEPGLVRLHIDSDEPVELALRGGGQGSGRYGPPAPARTTVCVSPCDAWIDGRAGQSFFVQGSGVPASRQFLLTSRSGDATLHVASGSSALRGLGIGLTATGAGAVLVGLVLVGTGSILRGSETQDTTAEQRNSDLGTARGMEIAGAITAGAGAAVLVVGIVLLTAARTNVQLAATPDERSVAASRPIAPRYWLGEF